MGTPVAVSFSRPATWFAPVEQRQTGSTGLRGGGRAAWPGSLQRATRRWLGKRLASVHRVSIEPSAELPIRRRAMDGGEGFLTERRRYAGSARWVAGERLLRRAEAELAQRPRPRDRIGLVHGDAWVGNAMALEGRCSGLFDWGSAGVGHPGVDVGYTRLSAALTYGVHAAADVLAGWEAGTGEPLASIAYWDVVAALVMPPDLGPISDVRDAFLLRALDATSPPA